MKRLVSGNQAIFLGALKAGVGFYAGYPITPASEITHNFANSDIPFISTEDEIAAINMIIGASMAGKKSMTATSGPGFSLMQESIGFAHMTQTPIVLINSQRVGPSTGMPTLTSQGDVMQSRYGTHGDVYPIVFTPNSIEESYKITIEAFNAAEESLSPVTILTDAFISQMSESLDEEAIDIKIKNRKNLPAGQAGKNLGEGAGHLTGLLSENGIPKTQDMKYYEKWFKEYKKRISDTTKNYNLFEYSENKNSKTILIAFGSVSRIISPLKNEFSIFRPIRLFPVLKEIKEVSKNYDKIVVLEMNDGQYATTLESYLKREVKKVNLLGEEMELSEIKEKI